ncbi:MAG: hypothetical protein E7487_03695 [Ruminococcaceae bacterium]|nr:hypothetical protein [Oscillospiraceae bacterium]MBQ3049625.1 hypothetical protein [Oscillospiraceae bacterium]MBQ9939641.1 hypothetical protein [Oscillospiraceae bacterium]
MKKWYQWLILSAVWLAAGAVNFFTDRPLPVLIYNAFCVLLFSALALCQFFLEKRGEKGKKLLKRIYIAAIVLCVLILIAALALSLL